MKKRLSKNGLTLDALNGAVVQGKGASPRQDTLPRDRTSFAGNVIG